MRIILKIELAGITDPVVWRKISVPAQYSFYQLHQVIQAAFGWKNSHLYMFSENGFRDLITINSPYDEEGMLNAKNIPIKNILINMYNHGLIDKKGKKLKYIYDYGDHWEHEIGVEDIEDMAVDTPELLDGKGAYPPEDCLGIPGFTDLKNELSTGEISQLRGESWMPWLKVTGYPGYDPNVFDVEEARRRVKGLS